MKLTKSQLKKIIKEEIEAVVSEDETTDHHPINQAAFLPAGVLDDKAESWINDLKAEAQQAAASGGPKAAMAQKFLDRIGDVDAGSLVQALIDVTMGIEKGSDIGTMAKSWERQDFGGGYQK
jgi:hypothetical protein